MPRVLDFIAGGWTLQYIGNYASAMPVNFGATATPNGNFATNRPIINNPDGGSLLNPNFGAPDFDMTDISNPRPDKKYIDTSRRQQAKAARPVHVPDAGDKKDATPNRNDARILRGPGTTGLHP